MAARLRRVDAAWGYGTLLPALVLGLALVAVPFVLTFWLSVVQDSGMNLAELGGRALSLENYQRAMTDAATWRSLWISIGYVALSVAPAFVIGLVTALLLNERFPGRRWFRTLILVPWAIPGVVAAVAFLWILDGSFGVLNYLLELLRLPSDIAWFSNPKTALLAVSLPTIWKGYPFFTLVLLAALQSVPEEQHEAAKMDGASRLGRFVYVTWPSIQGPAVLAVILQALWAFREFDFIFPTTGGGPNGATETLAIRIYNEAFRFFDLGTAAVLGVIALIFTAIIVRVAFPLMRGAYLD